jgi:hypothetical protein
MKHPVLVKKDYTIYFEYVDDFIAVHCDVYRWNKQVKKNWLRDSFYLFALQEKRIFAFVDKLNTKLYKFTKMNGFNVYQEDEVSTDDGNKIMFIWGKL